MQEKSNQTHQEAGLTQEKEDWIKSAVPDNEHKDIIVTTTDGYI